MTSPYGGLDPRRPRSSGLREPHDPRTSNVFHLVKISAVALGLHVVAVDKPQRRRVDAVAQAAAVCRAVGKDVPEMAVAMRRSHLGADHAMRRVSQLAYVGRLDRLCEAWPTASRFIFIGRSEQRLARYDVDVDAWFLVIQIFAGAGALGAALLGHPILFRRQSGNGFRGLAIIGHLSPFRRVSWLVHSHL